MSNQDNNFHNDWTKNISNVEEKLKLAEKITSLVKSGDIIGFGSGSTALLAVRKIAEKVKRENLKIKAIPTSSIIKEECEKLNIPTTTLIENKPDWAFDGADEVDNHNWLLKGRGGAMFGEKRVIEASPITYILVDSSKFVQNLCDKYPIPVECEIASCDKVKQCLENMGVLDIMLRYSNDNKPYITDQGNYIIDCKFKSVTASLEKEINAIPGVVENGLFIGYPIEILKI